MARPKSDNKRKAILDATLRIFAEHGIAHAPTSAISKAAGVAEGSLFTYFKTKDELMNELYREMRQDFDRALANYPYKADAQSRLRFMWDRFVDLGVAQPERLTVMRQLRASGNLLKENETPGLMILEALSAIREAIGCKAFNDVSLEFLVLQLRASAEATIEFVLAHPEQEAASRNLGFMLVWRGLTGQ
jgi:AcrR family transcriptional regulator